jgi:hypothetical protein
MIDIHLLPVTKVFGEDVDELVAALCNKFNEMRRVVAKFEDHEAYKKLFPATVAEAIEKAAAAAIHQMKAYEYRLTVEDEEKIKDPVLGLDKPHFDLVVRDAFDNLVPIKDRAILASESEEEILRRKHDGYVCDWDEGLRNL